MQNGNLIPFSACCDPIFKNEIVKSHFISAGGKGVDSNYLAFHTTAFSFYFLFLFSLWFGALSCPWCWTVSAVPKHQTIFLELTTWPSSHFTWSPLLPDPYFHYVLSWVWSRLFLFHFYIFSSFETKSKIKSKRELGAPKCHWSRLLEQPSSITQKGALS